MKHEENKLALEHLRHSAAHLLAAAVLELYPDALPTIGPAIENGFYYDFDFQGKKISDEDLPKIEQKMRELVKSWHGFEKIEVEAPDAKERVKYNPYKHELIDEIAEKNKKITFYKSGTFEDLCRGGHIEDPKETLKHFKLLSLAGAYWRGSEKNKMLTRVYGTAFPMQKELDEYLSMLEEAKKRDHKKLGRELDLFFFHETAPGMAYWLPKGLTLYNALYGFAREMYTKYGYLEVATPQLNKKELYETSGHWTHYRDDMFISPMSYITGASENALEGAEVFGVKPMNCPNAMNIFAIKTRSYHDLPLRLAETSSLHRFELSGTLNGLFRLRQFRQDDAHIFMAIGSIKAEFESLLAMVEEMYQPFHLSYKLRFGTRPEKILGEKQDWDVAEKELQHVLQDSKKEYFVAEGEGAFYGPKVDILMTDSLGREWQTGTIQLDFQQPKRFELNYINAEGNQETPVVIHRAIYGSLERFLGILVEHYAGKFPLWLAPIQVELIPIADRHAEYAQELATTLKKASIRAAVNTRSETLQSRIRSATLQKVPYLGIIGDKEVASTNQTLSVRAQDGNDLGQLQLADFIHKLQKDIDTKV